MIDKFFLIFFCLLPFSHFFFRQVDIWHGQGYFFQLSLLILFCLKIYQTNKPFAFLIFWVSTTTLYQCFIFHIKTQQYSLIIIPFFNFLCAIILYLLLVELKKETYRKILKYFSYSLLTVVVYCFLQKFNLDEFYRPLIEKPDELVGTIGNAMHLSQYLAMCLPVFFIHKPHIAKLFLLPTLVIILFTGSASGLFIALSVLIFYSIFLKPFTIRELILLSILIVIFLFWRYSDIVNILKDFTFSSGRFEIWKKYYPIFQKHAITGWGLGIVNALAKNKEFLTWRHLHNEFYHFAVELGLIGVGFIIWGIVEYFRRFAKAIKDNTNVIIVSVFLGFILSACFGYPAHMYLLAIMGICSYSYFYRREIYENFK